MVKFKDMTLIRQMHRTYDNACKALPNSYPGQLLGWR